MELGRSLDDIIREKKTSQRSEPYSLYDVARKAQQNRNASKGKEPENPNGKGSGRGLEGATLVGFVKSFNAKKAWGFVESEAIASRDIFLHIKECSEAIGVPQEGDWVEFELAHTAEGNPRAVAARPARALESAQAPRRQNSQKGEKEWPQRDRPLPWIRQESTLPVPPGSQQPPRRSGRGSTNGALADGEAERAGKGSVQGTIGIRVRILNFPWTMSWQALRSAFQECGEVAHVQHDERKVGQAIVTFRNKAAAQQAVEEYHRGWLNGREILVRYEK